MSFPESDMNGQAGMDDPPPPEWLEEHCWPRAVVLRHDVELEYETGHYCHWPKGSIVMLMGSSSTEKAMSEPMTDELNLALLTVGGAHPVNPMEKHVPEYCPYCLCVFAEKEIRHLKEENEENALRLNGLDTMCEENRRLNAENARLKEENERLMTEKANVVQQATAQAQEARTQRSIVLAILKRLNLPPLDWDAESAVDDYAQRFEQARELLEQLLLHIDPGWELTAAQEARAFLDGEKKC